MPFRKATSFSALLASLCLLFVSFNAQAQVTFTYTLYVEDQELGSISIEHHPQANGHYVITQHSHIKAPGFWGDLDFQGTLKETHASNGMLLKSGNKFIENDQTFWTKIELSGDEYLAFKAQLKNSQEQEDDESIDLAKGVVAHLVPGVGDVMMVGEFLLSDGNEKQMNSRFTKDSFDICFLDLPYFWKSNSYILPSSLRIFDTEEMFIFSTTISHKGRVELNINGTVIEASHYTLNVKDNASTEIWLAVSDADLPYFVQITGEDEGDAYKIAYKPNKLER
jgi:hypothetical protein